MTEFRTCKSCETLQPLTVFRERNDGKYIYRIWQCRDCEIAAKKVWVKENPEKVKAQKTRAWYKDVEKSRAKSRLRNDDPVRMAKICTAARARAKTPEGKAYRAEFQAKWRKTNPEKYVAQNKLNNALRDRKIQKKQCQVCGETEKVVAHHHDYSKPLDVIWLCRPCHAFEHRKPRWVEPESGLIA